MRIKNPSYIKPSVDHMLINKLRGKLLLQAEGNIISDLWYVSPKTGLKHKVTIGDALKFFKRIALVISNNDLSKIPIHSEPDTHKNITLRKRLVGKFLIEHKDKSRIWYVDTKEYKRREITAIDKLDMLQSLALKITNEDLNKIPNG